MEKSSTGRNLLGLIGWLALSFAAAAIGAVASANAEDFYSQLVRPSWAPPGWLFGPVWTVLYLMMGIAAWMVWRKRGFSGARFAISFFCAQLVANAIWSWLFFRWHQGALAFVEVIVLWFLILATIVFFWRVSKPAGALLVPYLAWVTFATALTFATWRSNSALLG